MSDIEERRSLLEDLEIIENSISKRFERNPELYYSYQKQLKRVLYGDIELPSDTIIDSNRIYKTKKYKKKRKQVLAQQYEINEFFRDYQKKYLTLYKNEVDQKAYRDEKGDLAAFDNLLTGINNKYDNETEELGSAKPSLDISEKEEKYSMFSASTSKSSINNILSKRSQFLDLNQNFRIEEQYGEILDLEKYYSDWLNVIKNPEYSLLKYVNIFNVFLEEDTYILNPPMDRKNQRYIDFIKIISRYLESFIEKTYILINWTIFKNNIKKEFEKYVSRPLINEKKGNFCISCKKWFKNSNVFDNHLRGKQHEKNYSNNRLFLLNEFKTHKILTALKLEYEDSKIYLERKLAFTSLERSNELKLLSKRYEEPVYLKGEVENEDLEKRIDQDNNLSKEEKFDGTFNMPLGPDGVPIPYWLYKLQGLDVTYNCEICGNKEYRGRNAFEKHFSELSHTSHLYFIGIEYSKAFKGITSISEAQDLWDSMNQIKDTNDTNDTINSNEIEVEDSEGNVMSKKVYDELKKQNLV